MMHHDSITGTSPIKIINAEEDQIRDSYECSTKSILIPTIAILTQNQGLIF